ncbi:hypothetical protein M0811_14167 [Anaeramoeba ignava]|uniref:Uncharacterized protein n=1 Tax=Anaeramoeba ignava TaxID=1746090 RepID=A0A9Q0LWK6_ANAIG|nr:hypothetical protein M0811_14167 [Anaeramoeba ignava]
MNTFLLFFSSLIFLILIVKPQITPSNSFNFPLGISSPYVSLIDVDEGFVYFADYDYKTLYKFNINTLQPVNVLDLEIHNIQCGVIDTVNKFAYFGAYTNPNKIAKVDLKTFTVVDILTLSTNGDGVWTGQIDVVNQKAYFAVNIIVGVVKIDLTTFTEEANLTLNTSNQNFWGSAIDIPNGFFYVFTDCCTPVGGTPVISKIDLSNFTEVGSLALDSSEAQPFCAVIDSSTGFMYLGTNSAPMMIVKGTGIDIDNELAYFVSRSKLLVKINLTDFTGIDSLSFTFTPNSMSVDLNIQKAFIGLSEIGVSEVDLTVLNQTDQIIVPNCRYPSVILVDEPNNIGYVAFSNGVGTIAKVDLDSFQLVDFLNTGVSDSFTGGEIDSTNGFAYFFLSSSGLGAIKLRLSNFSVDGVIILDSNCSFIVSAFDNQNHFVYVGFDNHTSNVSTLSKINSPNFEIVDTVILDNNEIDYLIVYSSKGFLYELLKVSGYFINQVALSNLSEVIDSTYLSNYNVSVIFLDSNHQYIYFGTDATYSEICRLGLTNTELFYCLEIEGVNNFVGSFIESSQTYGFFVSDFLNNETGEYETRIIQIETISNQLLSNTSIGLYLNGFIGVYDSTSRYEYASGYNNYPVPFIQFSVPNPPNPPPSSSSEILFSILIIGLMMMILQFF